MSTSVSFLFLVCLMSKCSIVCFFVLCQSVLSSGFHDITVLDLPDNMPDLNPIWNIWDIFRRKMRNHGSKNPDELKAQ